MDKIQIHLMFLFIPTEKNKVVRHAIDSNTSYVLVYQFIVHFDKGGIVIQIHLMFLFISHTPKHHKSLSAFKYILCSCLSISSIKHRTIK